MKSSDFSLEAMRGFFFFRELVMRSHYRSHSLGETHVKRLFNTLTLSKQPLVEKIKHRNLDSFQRAIIEG